MNDNRIKGSIPTNEYCKMKNFIDLFNSLLEL